MRNGKAKISRVGFQHWHCRVGPKSHGIEASEGRRFNPRPEAEKGVSRGEEARGEAEALAVNPFAQKPVKQAGEVCFLLPGPKIGRTTSQAFLLIGLPRSFFFAARYFFARSGGSKSSPRTVFDPVEPFRASAIN